MSTTSAPNGAQLQPVRRPDEDDLDTVGLAPIDRFQLLDVYAKGVVRERDGGARVDALATISAGDRAPAEDGKVGRPRVSRDGTIMLHDADHRAPGLKAALEASNYKKLSIAVGFDDPDLFLQQRFTAYTATALKLYGDQYRLMEIVTKGEPGRGGTATHVVHEAGSPKYDELIEQCKVSASLYFVLAEWDEDNKPRVLMPDGLGFYRLRTTSRHSLRNILGTLQYLSRFTGGRLAGVPLELQLTYREVADSFGLKRNIPTWSLAMKPPHGIVLSTRNFAPLIQEALAEGKALHVPDTNGKALMAPRAETWETAAAEGPEEFEPDDADIARLMAGDAPADGDYWRRRWFAQSQGSRYEKDAGRAEWMLEYTKGETNSLADWLKDATNADAERMLVALAEKMGTETREEKAATYERIYADDDQARSDAETRKAHAGADDQTEQEEIDPGDMGEGGWGESDNPDVGECELCGTITRLVVDEAEDADGQLVCADRDGCDERVEELDRKQKQDEQLDKWVADVRRQVEIHPYRLEIAEVERRRQVGIVIQRATGNDATASRELLKALTGSISLAKLSRGACDVLESEALKPAWAETIKLVLAKLPRTEPAPT